MGGRDRGLEGASAVLRAPSTTGNTPHRTRDTEGYKTGCKSYHKAFVIFQILTHSKNSECRDKGNQRTEPNVVFYSSELYKSCVDLCVKHHKWDTYV